MQIEFYPVRTQLIESGDDIVGILLESAQEQGVVVRDNDILVIASKVISYQQGRIIEFDKVKPSRKALRLAKKYGIPAGRVEVYLREADSILGGVFFQKPKYLMFLTIKNGILSANSGVDYKNCPPRTCSLQVQEPQKTAEELRKEILKRTGKRVGIIIADTEMSPLRLGAIGLAIATAGFHPVRNWLGGKDIYGNSSFAIARSNMADPIAAMATCLFGEGGDRVPFVIVRNANVDFSEGANPHSLYLSPSRDPLFSILRPSKKISAWYDWEGKMKPHR